MISYKAGYLNPQLESGPYASSYMKSVQAELGFPETQAENSYGHYSILQYLYNISIDSANSSGEAELGGELLDGIGRLVGYPWPSVYNADFENNFQFIKNVNFPGSGTTGFSGVDQYGNIYALNGLFTSANPASLGVYLNVPAYRSILKFVARVKWSGVSVIAIDELLSEFLASVGQPVQPGSYSIYIGNPSGGSDISNMTDIFVSLDMGLANIGVGYLFSLQLMFNRVCTMPQIQIYIS
jgi:hypothetical protein